jgi:hypothetical protein
VAVAEKCLPRTYPENALIEPLAHTEIATPLGRIVIGRVKEGGKLVLAGPVTGERLRVVLEALGRFGVQLAVVDGALSRIAPMAEADSIILATGAARNTDIEALSHETRCFIDLLASPALEPAGVCKDISSVLSHEGYLALRAALESADSVRVRGLVAEGYLTQLARERAAYGGKRVLFPDATKFLIAGEAAQVHAALETLRDAGTLIGVAKPIHPLAITINPFYPKLRYSQLSYDAAYVDREALFHSMTSHVRIPCFNVFLHSGEGLYAKLRACIP